MATMSAMTPKFIRMSVAGLLRVRLVGAGEPVLTQTRRRSSGKSPALRVDHHRSDLLSVSAVHSPVVAEPAHKHV